MNVALPFDKGAPTRVPEWCSRVWPDWETNIRDKNPAIRNETPRMLKFTLSQAAIRFRVAKNKD